jgi:lipopolysaccharide/colanic/teichoic acid biosynthesis glycosyltransferase
LEPSEQAHERSYEAWRSGGDALSLGLAKSDALPPGLQRGELPPGLGKRDELPPGLRKRDELAPHLRKSKEFPRGLRERNELPPGVHDDFDGRAHEWRERVGTHVPSQDPADSVSPIPEPGGLLIFSGGLLLAGVAVRRRRRDPVPGRNGTHRLPALDRIRVPRSQGSSAASAGTPDDWHVAPRPLYVATKRALDLSFSLLSLGVMLPVLLLIAASIKLEDGGPILFRQWRAGFQGRKFRMVKFRSMRLGAEELRGALRLEQEHASPRFKMQRDPRVTRTGRWLRRFSLDEIPQLWNVVLGDLSLVGPRPPLLEEVAEYEPHQHRRLDVAQGVTCTWQVSGRSLIPFEEQVELDLAYIRARSLLVDAQILLRTVSAVLNGRGAY